MQFFLNNSIAYGIIVAEEEIIKKSINQGGILQEVRIKSDGNYSLYRPDEEKKVEEHSSLFFLWTYRRELFFKIYDPKIKISEKLFDFYSQLISSLEGLEILKQQKENGVDFSIIIDDNGNNLIHAFFNPLNRGYDRSTKHMPVECLEFILEANVDPNQLNNKGKSPLHCVASFVADKSSGKKVGIMVKKGADLSLETTEGVSVRTHLLEAGLQSAEMIRFLKKTKNDISVNELQILAKRYNQSDKLVQAYVQKGALDQLKMLEYIYPQFKACGSPNQLRRLMEFQPEIGELLKEDKLKTFLEKAIGSSSSSLTNSFLNYYKERNDKKLPCSYDFLEVAVVAKELFSENGKINHDYMAKILSQFKIVTGLAHIINSCNIQRTVEFFNLFSLPQKYALLESINEMIEDNEVKNESGYGYSYYSRPYIRKGHLMNDGILLYWKYPQELKEILSNLKFTNINTLTKLHDVISKESTKIKQKPYNLEQEKHNEKLIEVNNQSLVKFEDYKIIVPQTNHELAVWGGILGNCVGGGTYAEYAKMGDSIILGIKLNDELKYCMQIRNKNIVQIEGKSRSYPNEALLKSIKETLINNKLINQK